LAGFVICLAASLQSAHAQGDAARRADSIARPARRTVQTATIHWRDVPLQDALARLTRLFDETTFLDRRIDPTVRANLDMSASSAQQVLTRIAVEHGWGVSRLGDVVYMGPAAAARQLDSIAEQRRQEIAKLPQPQRAVFTRKRALNWPRLAVPRVVVTELVKKNGWGVVDAERIPHDLWAAGQLNGLTFAEQLTMLLIGFDLTYEIRSEARTIAIVPIDKSASTARVEDAPKQAAAQWPESANGKTKQVYSLRVAEQPVGDVMRALSQRLNWQIDYDEAAIQMARLSVEQRVSFAVENVGQDELLDAVLRPAGLTFRREGEVITIVPR
jgi:hypothetical protein